jgi:hypothetical protein
MPDDTQLTALCAAVDVDDDTPVRVESREKIECPFHQDVFISPPATRSRTEGE